MQLFIAFINLQDYNQSTDILIGIIVSINKVSQKLIGRRIQVARESKGHSQDALTKALKFKNRQSISSIENGERAVKSEELLSISEFLDYDIEFFLDPFSVQGEAKFSWRASNELTEESLNNFEQQTSKWIGLLRWLREINNKQINPLKYSLKLTRSSSFEDAINCAENLVKTLNLGLIPTKDLIEKIEQQLDIPVLFVDSVITSEGHAISGASCHLQDLGIILINRNESEARRFYNLAHELFHILTWDAIKPDHRESNALTDRMHNKRIEQLADNFAAALLMPEECLSHFIDKKLINDQKHLLSIARELRVSPSALAYRLYNLKWIEQETANTLKKQKLPTQTFTSLKRFQPAFINMLHSAIDHGKLSAKKAAKALNMNLHQLTELFTEYNIPAPFEL